VRDRFQWGYFVIHPGGKRGPRKKKPRTARPTSSREWGSGGGERKTKILIARPTSSNGSRGYSVGRGWKR